MVLTDWFSGLRTLKITHCKFDFVKKFSLTYLWEVGESCHQEKPLIHHQEIFFWANLQVHSEPLVLFQKDSIDLETSFGPVVGLGTSGSRDYLQIFLAANGFSKCIIKKIEFSNSTRVKQSKLNPFLNSPIDLDPHFSRFKILFVVCFFFCIYHIGQWCIVI